jgi:peptide/nickel transport system substrate-binding protein
MDRRPFHPPGPPFLERSVFFDISVLAGFLLILSMLACGGGKEKSGSSGDSSGPTNGGTLIIGQISEPDALSDFVSTDASATEIMENLLFLPLTRYDRDLEIVPCLASSWEFSSDHRQLTFHLRRDVRWSDGVPTTAQDVAYSYRMWIDPELGWANRSMLDLVDSVRVVDDYTVTFFFQIAYADQLSDLQQIIQPRHLLERTPALQMKSSPFNRQPVGNGPFVLEKWVSNQYLEFRANDDYYAGRPYLDRIIFRIIPDQTALLTNLETGEIDMMEAVPPKDYERISKNDRLRVWVYPYRGYVYLGWNLLNPLFESRRVRQALTMAIDRQEIVDGLWYGMAQVCTGPVAPHIAWAYDTEIEPYPYDPERARQILAEEGWIDHDGDGWLDKDGRRFQFELKTNLGNQIREDVAVMVQRDLAEVGIKVLPRVLEWTVFIDQTESKDFDAFILAWQTGFTVNPTDIFHTKAIDGKYNMGSYSNPQADRLMDQGRRCLDRQQAGEIWRRFQEIIHQDQPYTFLYVPPRINAIDRRFRGVQMDIRGALIDIEQWWVPQDERKY